MRIALCSSDIPFAPGGARSIVEWLGTTLLDAGHDVEHVVLPHADEPDLLFRQMAAYRWVDLQSADRIIAFRPPAHFIPHPHKILWFIHHIRAFYDLWDSPYRPFPDDASHRRIRRALHAADTAAMLEAERVFTNSRVVSDRLQLFNGIPSEVLYPPLIRPERFAAESFNDEIVCVARIQDHKRQHLLVDALRFTKTPVKLRLCGSSGGSAYGIDLRDQIRAANFGDRVTFEDRWITDSEKSSILGSCLAAAYVPVDEDSYGYATLEAAHSSKPLVTSSDSGGVLEFVEHGFTGIVAEPDPEALGAAMDRLFLDRENTRRMGENARERIDQLDISWDHVLSRLLA